MSFALDLKTELCEAELKKHEEKHAFAYGMALFARRFSAEYISFTIAHILTAELFKETMLEHAGVEVQIRETERTGMLLYNVTVRSAATG